VLLFAGQMPKTELDICLGYLGHSGRGVPQQISEQGSQLLDGDQWQETDQAQQDRQKQNSQFGHR
jgi:hypothetical protein